MICEEWMWSAIASPGAIPRRLQELRQNIARFILPDRRKRAYPRAVKVKMSKYPKKQRSSTSCGGAKSKAQSDMAAK